MVVPFPAGGGADFVARLFGDKLAVLLGQRVVIDKQPAASGNIGAEIPMLAETGSVQRA